MKKIISILFLIAVCASAFAQTTISGYVRDAKGEPVIGAVITFENDRSAGVVTDLNGHYSTRPSAKAGNMSVSCLGYKTATITPGKRSVIDVVMEEDNEQLDELIVVGYGSMRRGDLTGAVQSVKIDEENVMKNVTLDQMLDGKVAGVEVLSDSGNPDAGISVQIRGNATFSANSQPLYVVDGIIINGQSETLETFASSIDEYVASETETTNPLAGINPQDIESMEVLKDASATAIYGSQGANGVIIITTKQGQKSKPTIKFNAGVSIGQASNKIDLCTFDEFIDRLEEQGNGLTAYYKDPKTRTGLLVTPVDWQDYIMRTAISQRYYLSVSGKPKTFNYFFSLGFNRTQGVLKCTDSDSYTARLNLSKDITKSLKLSLKSSFGYTSSNLVSGGAHGGTANSNSSLMNSVLRSKPFFFKAPDEEDEDEEEADGDEVNKWGPKRFLENVTNKSSRFRVTPALTLDWKITGWLSFRSTFGADLTSQETTKTRSSVMTNGLGNTAGFGYRKSLRWNWDNLLMVNKKWGKHHLSGTLGQSMSKVVTSYQSFSSKTLPQKYAYGADISYADPELSYISKYSEPINQLLSFFGRVVYNYGDRYILTSTLRFDGSSRFKGSKKWGIFPSAAFAWRIANEPWFKVRCISNAKLRLGWGQTGNQDIGSYMTTPFYAGTNIGNHYESSGKDIGIILTNIVNPDLKWETNTQWNAGLDLGFFKGRLSLAMDFYDKTTSDLLQNKKVAYSSGYTSMYVNDGIISNRGFELSVDAVPVKIGDFEWSLGGNISLNRNKIVNVGAMGDSAMIRLTPDSDPVQCNFFRGSGVMSAYITSGVNVFIEGQPMGLFYGYVFDGIVQEGEAAGAIIADSAKPDQSGYCRYRDLDGDGKLTVDDKTIIGNPNAKFTYGFNTTLSYKRFTLNITTNGCYGRDIANLNRVIGYWTTTGHNCLREAYVNAWRPDRPSNTFPKLGTVIDNGIFSDRYIEDGSYFRISNISLSYSFPFKKSAKVLHGLTIAGSVGNPFVFTKYTGYTPAIRHSGMSVHRMGIDLNTTPLPRTYNFDVKFTF